MTFWSSLLQCLSKITDPRGAKGKQHDFTLLLGLALLAKICGINTYKAIGDWLIANECQICEFTLKEILPSHLTIRRALVCVNAQELSDALNSWVNNYCPLSPEEMKFIAIDGKWIGKTGINVLSAFCTNNSMVIGALETEAKSNEIPLVRKVLSHFNIKNCIITLDALHCQKKHVKTL